jgi:hypothetical protein
MATCSTNALLDSSVQFQALDNRQLLLIIAQLLCQQLKAINPMASCDASSLLQSACNNKLECLENRQVWIVIAQLLCEILIAGGGSGNSCITCGTTDPVDPPTCDCAIHYRTDTGSFFVWTGVWQPILLGP